jgi:hypothetical protein
MTTIPDLINSYSQLRLRITARLGMAMPDISNVLLPSNVSDEISFFRLVIWGYIVTQESGKIQIGFLQNLPPLSRIGPDLPELSLLRTWISHNLDLAKEGDIKKIRATQQWFRKNCEVGSPASAAHWGKCIDSLIQSLGDLFAGVLSACDLLDSEVDGDRLVAQLKDRIDRKWEAYRFDTYAMEAVKRLGFNGIDPIELRKKNLDSWRKIVATSEPNDWDRILMLRIEKDLLDLMHHARPKTSLEILRILELGDSKQICGAVMLLLHCIAKEDRDTAVQVIDVLQNIGINGVKLD